MDWLNYHHLLYFWTTATEGGVGAAARKLKLAQPTISGQLRELERTLGVELFRRTGRRLELTPMGRRVFERADAIFSIGREILDLVGGHSPVEALRLVVGFADVLPNLVRCRLLQPALQVPEPVYIVSKQDTTERLLADLATQAIDLMLTDAPIRHGGHVRAYSHLLAESDVAIFASPALALELRPEFPRSLNRAPLLLPTETAMLRRSLESWWQGEGIEPRPVGEFDDGTVLGGLAQAGVACFAAPTSIATTLQPCFGLEQVGVCAGIQERYYAVTLERRVQHPAIAAISAVTDAEHLA
jgi:LysR family transcriptional activator of nhaA